ncbi:MAG: OmpA family protein [Bacteroidota bacterium]
MIVINIRNCFLWMLFCSLCLASCTYTIKVRDGYMAHDRKQYDRAVPMLKSDYKKAKSRLEKGKIAYLIADAYRNTNDMTDAINWYRIAYDNQYGTDALKGYAQALKQDEQYEAAIQAFRDLGIEIGSPYEYRREIKACELAQTWKKAPFKVYEVSTATFNSTQSDYAPTLYKNDQLVFTSDRSSATGEDTYEWTGNAFSDIFMASKNGTAATRFDEPINSAANEGTLVFNEDFTEAYFTRCIGQGRADQYCKLMMSKAIGDTWSVPKELKFVKERINYSSPSISSDGSQLYFSCNDPEGWGGYDIWVAERSKDGWGVPRILGRSINTEGDELFPTIEQDTLYFSSDYHPGMGGLDIFKTYRLNGRWTAAENLKTPINSASDDFGYIIDKEAIADSEQIEYRGYFTSSRPTGKGKDDIYQFTKLVLPPPPPVDTTKTIVYQMKLEVYVLEKIYENPNDPSSKMLGRKPLSNADVQIVFGKNAKKTRTTNEQGYLSLALKEATDYALLGSKEGYLSNQTSFSTKGIARDPEQPERRFEVELVLDKIFQNQEIVLENIYYDFDKSEIRADAQPTLDQLAEVLQLNPNIAIELASHTDCQGSNSYNERLSQARAEAAVRYLTSRGIDAERMRAKGYGETALLIDCICARCTEQEHQRNRRTTFKIVEL